MPKNKVYFIDLAIANKHRHICDIVEKLYGNGQRTVIYVNDNAEAHKLDRYLWTWKQDSFIPHAIVNSNNGSHDDPVRISMQKDNLHPADVLILFDPLTSEYLNNFPIVIDFAETFDSQKIKLSRERYKTIRDNPQFEIEFSKLGAFLQRKDY